MYTNENIDYELVECVFDELTERIEKSIDDYGEADFGTILSDLVIEFNLNGDEIEEVKNMYDNS